MYFKLLIACILLRQHASAVQIYGGYSSVSRSAKQTTLDPSRDLGPVRDLDPPSDLGPSSDIDLSNDLKLFNVLYPSKDVDLSSAPDPSSFLSSSSDIDPSSEVRVSLSRPVSRISKSNSTTNIKPNIFNSDTENHFIDELKTISFNENVSSMSDDLTSSFPKTANVTDSFENGSVSYPPLTTEDNLDVTTEEDLYVTTENNDFITTEVVSYFLEEATEGVGLAKESVVEINKTAVFEESFNYTSHLLSNTLVENQLSAENVSSFVIDQDGEYNNTSNYIKRNVEHSAHSRNTIRAGKEKHNKLSQSQNYMFSSNEDIYQTTNMETTSELMGKLNISEDTVNEFTENYDNYDHEPSVHTGDSYGSNIQPNSNATESEYDYDYDYSDYEADYGTFDLTSMIEGIDFSEINFDELDLSSLDLTGVDLSGIDFSGLPSDINLENFDMSKLPKNMDLNSLNLTSLPENISVTGLNLSELNSTEFAHIDVDKLLLNKTVRLTEKIPPKAMEEVIVKENEPEQPSSNSSDMSNLMLDSQAEPEYRVESLSRNNSSRFSVDSPLLKSGENLGLEPNTSSSGTENVSSGDADVFSLQGTANSFEILTFQDSPKDADVLTFQNSENSGDVEILQDSGNVSESVVLHGGAGLRDHIKADQGPVFQQNTDYPAFQDRAEGQPKLRFDPIPFSLSPYQQVKHVQEYPSLQVVNAIYAMDELKTYEKLSTVPKLEKTAQPVNLPLHEDDLSTEEAELQSNLVTTVKALKPSEKLQTINETTLESVTTTTSENVDTPIDISETMTTKTPENIYIPINITEIIGELQIPLRKEVLPGSKEWVTEAEADENLVSELGIGRLTNMAKTVSFSGKGNMDFLICTMCKTGVLTGKKLMNSLQKSEREVTSLIIYICIQFDLFPKDVCRGLINSIGNGLLHVIRVSRPGPARFCASLLPARCTAPALPRWRTRLSPAVSSAAPAPAPTSGDLKILHITDLHLDLDYAEGSVAACGDSLCCRKESRPTNVSAVAALSARVIADADDPDTDVARPLMGDNRFPMIAGRWGAFGRCDLPLRTVTSLLRQASALRPDLVYITGDLSPHDVWQQSRTSVVSAVEAATLQVLAAFPETPVVMAVGNHDMTPVNSFATSSQSSLGHSPTWAYEAMASLWAPWVPLEARASLKRGGYYSTVPLAGLRVISLNTNYCNTMNWWLLLAHRDPAGQMAWLVNQLAEAEAVGERVHILSHIPPGSSACEANWSTNFAAIVTRYAHIVTGIFAGHQHMDQWQVIYDPSYKARKAATATAATATAATATATTDTANTHSTNTTNAASTATPATATTPATTPRSVAVTYIAPSASTFRRHSPSFRLYAVDGAGPNATWAVADHTTYTANLTSANAGAELSFLPVYSARSAFGLQDLSPSSWAGLVNRMASSRDLFDLHLRYKHNYWAEPSELQTCGESCRRKSLCFLLTGDSSNDLPCQSLQISAR